MLIGRLLPDERGEGAAGNREVPISIGLEKKGVHGGDMVSPAGASRRRATLKVRIVRSANGRDDRQRPAQPGEVDRRGPADRKDAVSRPPAHRGPVAERARAAAAHRQRRPPHGAVHR